MALGISLCLRGNWLSLCALTFLLKVLHGPILDKVHSLLSYPRMTLSKTPDFSLRLKEAGLQVTAQRLAVQRAIATQRHATSEQVCEQVRSEIGTVSKQAVYDALRILTDHGFLRRIEPANSPARYETRVDNHHHLICRSCGNIKDVDCAKGNAPCMDPLKAHGYLIDEAEVIYWGLCPACQSHSKTSH